LAMRLQRGIEPATAGGGFFNRMGRWFRK